MSSFRKLNNTADPSKTLEAKMTAKIVAKCDPATPGVEHTLQDILGTGAGVPQPINAENINAWCANFGGDGAINTVQEWVDCIVAANECAGDQAISTHYPRALQWFDQVRPAMLALVPQPTDAIAALDAVNTAMEGGSNDEVPNFKCGEPCGTCGNGVREGVESCDGADLGAQTCQTLGFASGTLACTSGCGFNVTGCANPSLPATGQTTCWNASGGVISCAGTGHDGDIQAGATLAYIDNGDGTITDVNTGLMWEKLSGDGSIHNWNNYYTWTDAFAVKVATLNSGNFAGHNDWRVPNYKELVGILNLENVTPAVSPAFHTGCVPGCNGIACACTQSYGYWSSTTYADVPGNAWVVGFYVGGVYADDKTFSLYVRAVRGGL